MGDIPGYYHSPSLTPPLHPPPPHPTPPQQSPAISVSTLNVERRDVDDDDGEQQQQPQQRRSTRHSLLGSAHFIMAADTIIGFLRLTTTTRRLHALFPPPTPTPTCILRDSSASQSFTRFGCGSERRAPQSPLYTSSLSSPDESLFVCHRERLARVPAAQSSH